MLRPQATEASDRGKGTEAAAGLQNDSILMAQTPAPSRGMLRPQATEASDRGKGTEAAISAALPELLDAVSLSMPCREMCEVC